MIYVDLILASPIDLEAIVNGDDPPAYVTRYRIRAVRCDQAHLKPSNGRALFLCRMIQPEGDALQAARDIFDQHNIDIMAMQRWKREQTGTDEDGNPVYGVVTRRRANRAALSGYVRKVWQYDENGDRIPDSDVWPSQFPHQWAGQPAWEEE